MSIGPVAGERVREKGKRMNDIRRVMRVPWYPPMLVISGAGVLIGAYQLTGQILNPQAMIPIGAGQSLLAIALEIYATVGQMFEASHYLGCLGIRGFSRPLSGFELSRFSWMLLLFLISMFVAVLLCQWQWPQYAAWSKLFGYVVLALGCLGVTFLSASSMGYVMALIRWRMPQGRGFECTHFFYVIIVGVSTTGWSVAYYPPAAFWPDGIILSIGGLVGISVPLAGMISIAMLNERRELYATSEQSKLTPCDSSPPLPNPLPRGGGEGT